MAVVTSDVLSMTLAGIKTNFEAAYLKAAETAAWSAIATELPTTLPSQQYAWLGRGAVMEQFKDRAREQPLNQFNYTLSDILYKGKMNILRTAIEDDQYGLLMLRAQSLGTEPTRHWNQLAYTGLTAGFSNLGYDGQNFFSSSHQEGASPTQSNTTTSTLSDAALETAERTMMNFQDDKGVPMEITPNVLVVGPALKRRAFDLLGSSVKVVNIGDGTAGSGATASTPIDNYFDGRYTLVVNHYIYGSAQYNWFLCDTTKPVKPLFIQSRSDVPITFESDMADPAALIKEEFQVTARGRYAQGYGLWQMCYGSSASS